MYSPLVFEDQIRGSTKTESCMGVLHMAFAISGWKREMISAVFHIFTWGTQRSLTSISLRGESGIKRMLADGESRSQGLPKTLTLEPQPSFHLKPSDNSGRGDQMLPPYIHKIPSKEVFSFEDMKY